MVSTFIGNRALKGFVANESITNMKPGNIKPINPSKRIVYLKTRLKMLFGKDVIQKCCYVDLRPWDYNVLLCRFHVKVRNYQLI